MNRESATRVREREKFTKVYHVSEIEELRKENSELMIQNASYSAENSMLKQQIIFMEKLLLKSKYSDSTVVDISEKSTCSFDLSNKRIKEDHETFDESHFLGSDQFELHDQLLPAEEEEPPNFYRINSPFSQPQNFHFSLLTIFTVFLSVFAWQIEGGKPEMPAGQFANGNLSPKSMDDIESLRGDMKKLNSFFKDYEMHKEKLSFLFIFLAFLYFCYLIFLATKLFKLKRKKIKIF